MNWESLRNIAKQRETIFAKVWESLWKPVKSYLGKLAKPKYFCEIIFANLRKACENTCILHSLNLANTRFAKTSLQNLAKGVFIAGPPSPPFPLLRTCQKQPSLLSMVILNVFRLFISTFPKSIISSVFFSFVCPKCFIMYANQTVLRYKINYTVVSSTWESNDGIVCNLPDLSCSDIFFRFKLLSRPLWNDRTSASLIHLSLNVFSIFLTLAKCRWKKT